MPRPKGSTKESLQKKRKEEDWKPKGKVSAYAFFVQTCREEHRKQHPDEQVEFGEFAKKCSERWKTMSDQEKKRFIQMEAIDKKRLATELATMSPGDKKRKKTKKVKDPNAPRRSMSAFFWFSKECRSKVKEANPNFGVGDIAKELGRRWAEATPEEKVKYEQEAEKDRERYNSEKREYLTKKSVQTVPDSALVDSDLEEDEESD